MAVILASGSPRRKELIKLLYDEYEVRVSDADETVGEGLSPAEVVTELAFRKAMAVPCEPSDILISADTVVAFGDVILGKPSDRENAAEMLRMLSGRKHGVYTGVCIRHGGNVRSFYEKTDVEFYELSEEEILAYVATGECDDKAGAYGIQGKGGLLVRGISGDYNNVVGFPVARIAREIKAMK